MDDPDLVLNIKIRRPLLCRLGIHQWYGDGALFSHVDRCSRCDKAKDQAAADRLAFERETWSSQPRGLKPEESMGRVLEALAEYDLNHA